MAFEEFSWTTGPMSVDLRKISSRSKQDESIVKRIARTAQVICETDQRIAAVLGESYMPGCVLIQTTSISFLQHNICIFIHVFLGSK